MRLLNRQSDLRQAQLTEEDVAQLRVSDFTFQALAPDEKYERYPEVRAFIERHEWLGTMPMYATHIFTARLHDFLAGVIIMNLPSMFSKLLGDETKDIERLISRGCCISWSPKNLASTLLMWAIRWMAYNTPYRLFTAYSDPTARELGTIYQACNFLYLGKTHGTEKQYRYPGTTTWYSDRVFRQKSAYMRYCAELGLRWNRTWESGDGVRWDAMPEDIATKLRQRAKEHQVLCEVREAPPKHKYCYILGSDKRETKALRKRFAELHPHLVGVPYPKDRGE
jgi:hypothetical protein